jgi:hypothetical protein
MKKLSITKSGVLTNQASFETQEELDAWLSSHIGMGSFGSPRYEMQSVEISPAVLEMQQVLVSEAVMEDQEMLDSEGSSFDPPQFQQVEVSPAVYEEQEVEIQAAVFEDQQVEVNPDGYEIDIQDISAQLAQEELNAESLKYLAETDWMVIRELDSGELCPQDIKDARSSARALIVK